MSGLLRRSGALASVASRSLYTPARSSLRPARILRAAPSASWTAQSARCFATKKDKDSDKEPAKENPKGDNGQQGSPHSPPEVKSTDSPGPSKPLPEGWEHVTDEEFKLMLDLAKPPAFIRKIIGIDDKKVGARFAFIRETGVPSDMKKLLAKQTRGEDLDIADHAKLLKSMNTLLSKAKENAQIPSDPNTPSDSYKSSGTKDKKATDFTPNSEKSDKSGDGEDSQKSSGSQKPPSPSPSGRGMEWGTTIISTLVAWYIWESLFGEDGGRDISWQEMRKNFLDRGLVEKMVVMGSRVRVELNKEATSNAYPDTPAAKPGSNYYFTIGSVETFERHLDQAQDELGIPSSERIPVSYSNGSSGMDMFLAFGPTALLVGLLIYVQRRGPGGGGSGIFGVGKSKAKKFNHESAIKIKFADVAGMDEAKQEILEFVSFLKQPERFQRLGAKIPRGAILAGPPGTGKTMLAKATAGESGVPFYSVSGSEFVEMFVGVGASRVRDLFSTARKNAPCIIFIDEIDAIGKSRSEGKNVGGGHDEREATLNQILTEMDGFNTSEQVVVLAGTNRVDILDRALMRPGRFDRHVNIDKPTMAGRQDIFKVYLKKIVTNEEFEYLSGRLSALTPGFAGADIANCVNEAALIAARAEATSVTMQHFEQAIERVIGGLERKSLVLAPKEKRTVAYHEAGHAICGWFFEFADPLLKVSIIPRGMGLGYAQYLPGDAYLMNYQQLMDRMAMTLGGRISEEMHFPTVTTGAADDFKKVTQMATAMVTQYGMSDRVGPVHFPNDGNSFTKPFAEATGQTIDQEIKTIIEKAYKQCRDLLESKRKEIELIAEELLTKEVLVRDDMVRLLGKRPFEDRDEFNKYFNNEKPEGGNKNDPAAPPSEGEPKAPDSPPSPDASATFKSSEESR